MAYFKKIFENKKLVEAGFTLQNYNRGFELVSNQLSKRLLVDCKILSFIQQFVNVNGYFNSVIMCFDYKGKFTEVRFNMHAGSNNTNKVVSVDIFLDAVNKLYPQVTLQLLESNILQVLDSIVDAIKNPTEYESFRERFIKEKLDDKDLDFKEWIDTTFVQDSFLTDTRKLEIFKSYEEWAYNNNKTIMSVPTFNNVMKKYLDLKGLVSKFDRVRSRKPIKKEKKVISDELQELLDYVEKEMGSDIGQSLENLVNDIKVISGNMGKNGKNMLIAYGKPGLGKSSVTFDTMKELETSNIPVAYTRISVKSIADFYKAMYVNNGKLILIDDSNEIIKKNSKVETQILALTDTTAKFRRLTYLDKKDKDIQSEENPKGKYKQSFLFTGGLIFITNLPLPKISSPVLDRAIVNEIEASNESILDAIESGIDSFYTNVPLDIKLASIDFLKMVTKAQLLDVLSFRVYQEVLDYFNILGIQRGKVVVLKKIKAGLFQLYK